MKILRRKIVWTAAAFVVLIGFLCGFFTLFPFKYVEEIKEFSEKYGLPPPLVCAVIHAESRFRQGVRSPKGASGLMQLMKGTADWGAETIGLEGYDYEKITDPRVNIELGCWYLKTLLLQFGQEKDTALAAYNAGSGNVSKWLKDENNSADGKTLYNIPFGETKRYVEKINRSVHVYSVFMRVFGGFYK